MDRRTWLSTAAWAGVSLWLRPALAGDEPLAVFVHPKNGAKSLNAQELAAIFMSRRLHWEGSGRIIAFNYPARHPVRVSFDRAVLGMGPDEVARYWIDQRIRGGNPPPRQVPNGALIPKLVEQLEAAIGYAPASEVSQHVHVVAVVKNGKVETP
jgi:hypothetical protein